ncbi:MAG: hypothetical protein JWO06_767 [Bacteroidota bacterium]|nr:hypothetical protein [Bacteroidota bacterium]
MASAFTHAFASVAIGELSFIKKTDWKFWVLGMFCAAIPDADSIGYFLKVPYESLWGHRGFTHSIFFALVLALAVTYFFYKAEKTGSKRWLAFFGFFFFATVSHGILDAMTTGGKGVAFFAPFYNARYFFEGFRPIRVSPMSVLRFFTERGWEVMKSEFVWVWLPCLVVIAIAEGIKRLFSYGQRAAK